MNVRSPVNMFMHDSMYTDRSGYVTAKAHVRFGCGQGCAGWQLHEEVAIAALSCGRPSIADTLIAALEKRFPRSKRLLCLKGMAFEAIGNFDGAEKLYDEALEVTPTFAEALKRKVCLVNFASNTVACHDCRSQAPCGNGSSSG